MSPVGFLRSLIRRVTDKWIQRTRQGWKGKWRKFKRDRLSLEFVRGAFMVAVGLYLWFLATSIGWVLLLSYSYLMVQSILWASFLDRPYVFVLAYVVVVIRSTGTELLIAGDWVGGLIIFGVALYLWYQPKGRK